MSAASAPNSTGNDGAACWRRNASSRICVPAVDAYPVAGDVRRREERKPHDVVPVHVGHEDVKCLRRRRVRAAPLTPWPNARTPVPRSHSTYSGRRFRSPRRTCGRRRFRTPASRGRRRRLPDRRPTRRSVRRPRAQPGISFVADAGRRQRHRQRPARTPEPDALHRAAASYAASAGAGHLPKRVAHRAEHIQDVVEAAMSKISGRPAAGAATPIPAVDGARLPRRRSSTRRPMLLM